MKRLLAVVTSVALVILVAVRVSVVPPASADVSYNPPPACAPVSPRGTGADDVSNIAATITRAGCAQLTRGGSYTFLSTLTIPSGAKLDINGATITCDLTSEGLDAGYNPSQACILAQMLGGTNTTSTTALLTGGNQIGVVSDAGAVGQWTQVIGPVNVGQQWLIKATDAGADGSTILQLDSPAEWDMADGGGATVTLNTQPPVRVEVAGGNGTLLVKNAQRAIELTECQWCSVHDLRVAYAGTGSGWYYAGMSFDNLGRGNIIERVVFDGGNAPGAGGSSGPSVCLWLENQRLTTLRNVETRGCVTGVYSYASTGMILEQLWTHDNIGDGAQVSYDGLTVFLSDRGNLIKGGVFEKNGARGLVIGDADVGYGQVAPGWTVDSSIFRFNNYGIALINSDVDSAGSYPTPSSVYAPVSGIRLLNLQVVGNTVNGLDALNAHDVLVEGGIWDSNGTTGGGGQAIIFRSTVIPPVRIANVRTSRNGVLGNGVGGVTLVTDATVTGYTSDDDVVGLNVSGTGTAVTVTGGAYVGRTHAATWAGIYTAGSAVVHVDRPLFSYISASAYASTTVYHYLDQVVTSSKAYELQVSGCTAGATAPSATSGIQVMADGCAWLYRGASTQSLRYAVQATGTSAVYIHGADFRAVAGAYNVDTTESIGLFANGGTFHYADPWLHATGLDFVEFNGTASNESTGFKSYH